MFRRNHRTPTRGVKRRSIHWARHSDGPRPEVQPSTLSQGQVVGGIVCMIFLVVLFPPLIIVFLIWGIVKVATR